MILFLFFSCLAFSSRLDIHTHIYTDAGITEHSFKFKHGLHTRDILISMVSSTSNFDAAFSSNSTFASSYIPLPTLEDPMF